MGNKVFANGREVSCKAAAGKSICAFPDVCLTPPSPPAGPIPIPYPNTGMSSDCSGGSTTVKISGKEVMLKDKSYFKKSTGDEAATKSQGMGVVTHQIQGKVYFTAWSMDVKFEGENVVRHLDLTTHNHASAPGQTPPWPYLDSMSAADADLCKKDKEKEETACKGFKPYGDKDPCPPKPAVQLASKSGASAYSKQVLEAPDGASQCLAARRCSLQPYDAKKGGGGCCDGQTPHHLVEASAFHIKGRGDAAADASTGNNVKLAGCGAYDMNKAPCICVEGAGHGVGTHGLMHTFQSAVAMKCAAQPFSAVDGGPAMVVNKKGQQPKPFSHPATSLASAQKSGAKAVSDTFPESKCTEECIEAQLKAYHEGPAPQGAGMKGDQTIKAVFTCKPDAKRLTDAGQSVQDRKTKFDAIAASKQVTETLL